MGRTPWPACRRASAALGILLAVWAAAAQAAAPTVIFVLDASGSMAQKLGKTTKMAAAKATFAELVSALPSDMRVGLEVYGHRGDKDCSAIELLVPPGPVDPQALTQKVQALSPRRGATPIADALRRAAEVLKDAPGARTVVLISDGRETCGGDPVAAVKALRAGGIDVQVHVVGFAVGKKDRAQLEAIAAAGNGRYYDAKDAAGLQESFRALRRTLTARTLLRETFDGDALDPARWSVERPSPDGMLVEDGRLQLLALPPAGGKLLAPVNLVVYKEKLPKEYEIEAHVRLTQRSGPCVRWWDAPMVGLQLARGPKDGILFVAGHSSYHCGSQQDAVLLQKISGDKGVAHHGRDIGRRDDHEVHLRIRREGRKFLAFYRTDATKWKWTKLGEVGDLRSGHRLGLFALRGGKEPETLVSFDEVIVRELSR